jgi:hypothetical protein
MHFSAPAFIALLTATLAIAAPSAEPNNKWADKYKDKKQYIKDCKKDLDDKWKQKDDHWKKNEKVFYFDAEYIVKAVPEEVIGSNQAPAPGQPGAKGLFKYGINIADNTICYVCRPPPPLTFQPRIKANELLRTSLSPASPAPTSLWL